ncbi:sigma-70 family RNA polymerase sigma factor [Sinomonas gamaensis]|uniref:sigma-70 family RNA polymerase sigma factor n=1 Tax=Sinomonas gamaensis TaxID=2565624 RepID=UPI001486BA25|nr:sigma-70 family RNA polymerase sigma factor [Sinomonas gamaensis]
MEYLAVADALARRYRCPGHDAEDLRQVARLGLMKAAQRYEDGQGRGFVAYAVPTIAGELKRYLRDQAWTVRPPRSVQELRLKVRGAVPDLTQRLGREPTPRELADELGLTAAEVCQDQAAEASLGYQPIKPTDTTEDSDARRFDSTVMAFQEPGYEEVDSSLALSYALGGATEEETRILHLRFAQEMSQQQIADELGVSQMQVSRLLRRLLNRLRRRLAA